MLLLRYGKTVKTELSDVPETGIVYIFPLESNIYNLVKNDIGFFDIKVIRTTI